MSTEPNKAQTEKKIMGKIIQKAALQNSADLRGVREGYMKPSEVRETEVEFLVDTGAAMLSLPPEIIKKLGLYVTHKRRAVTATGEVIRRVYSPVRVVISGREANMDVMETSADTPPLLGYIPLEMLDLYPNPQKGCPEGNPKYGGGMVTDLL
jgi:clan AA aspartic protease